MGPSHRRGWTIGTAVVASVIVYVGLAQVRRASDAARLPVLPDFAAEPPALRSHLVEYDRAARAAPTSPEAVGALGIAYHADAFYVQADQCYAIAEKLAPREWRWAYYRALVAGERGQTEGVLASLQRVVGFAPDYVPAWQALGDAAYKAGRHEIAEDAWRRVQSLSEPPRSVDSSPHVAIAPMSAYAALGLARLALERGSADAARAFLEPVTTGAPRFGPAFRLLAEAYAALGRPLDAARAVYRADTLPVYAPPTDPMVDRLARESRSSTFLLQQASTADLALNGAWREYLIRRALEFNPENPDVVYEMGTVLHQRGRNVEALNYFRRYQQMVQGEYRGLTEMGKCLSDLRRFAEAESVLRRALQGTDDAITHFDLGYVLDQQRRSIEALAEYERAIAVNPSHIGARINLAGLLARQGKLAEAAAQLDRALEIDPENADAHANLGTVLVARGENARASKEFQAALRMDPRHSAALRGLQMVQGRP